MSLAAPSPENNRGVLSHQGVRYCILPRDLPNAEGTYYKDGPLLATPTDAQGRLIDVRGARISDRVAVPFAEGDLWVASDQLVTVKDWPVYPFSPRLFDLPLAVVEQVFDCTTVWREGSRADVEIDWGGIRLARSFTLGQLGVGIAVWPPRVLPDWQHFFFLFAPGTAELVETKRVPLFAEREPVVYGIAPEAAGGRLVAGELKLVRDGGAAFCRLAVPPRWLGFRSRLDPAVTHGILPLDVSSGALRMPAGGERWRHPGTPPSRRATVQEPVRLAVDFGTSNTALAVATGSASSARKLSFTPASRAVNLTAPAGLDPTLSPEFRYRFFPLIAQYENPMPSILMEFREAEPFAGSWLLPCRSIPVLAEAEQGNLLGLARTGNLKQNFKWRAREDGGPDQRRAFMEHLALVVGWELRTQEPTAERSRLELAFTRPLAFGSEETEQATAAAGVFRDTLTRCGFQVESEQRPPVSESLANFLFVSDHGGEGHGGRDERHVVIDIGGGTTDICIFKDRDTPLLFDSLYIGGKDLAEAFLARKLGDGARLAALADALGLPPGGAGAGRDSTEVLQWQLVSLMAKGGERGVAQIAERFNDHQLRDLLGQMVALLTFATLYAVRMAIQPRPDQDLPAAGRVWLQYAGLGARLFQLCPLAPGQMDRWLSAKQLLQRAIRRLPEASDLELSFTQPIGKESVCLGALAALLDGQPDAEHPDVGPELRTLWWAETGDGSTAIHWSDLYDGRRLAELDLREVEGFRTEQLFDCFRIAVEEAGKLGFDVHWQPDAARLRQGSREVRDSFIAACKEIRKNDRRRPAHPVRSSTGKAKAAIAELLE
jgi:hypothetical protein